MIGCEVELPGDFADPSPLTILERLNIAAIATLDRDFNIYRRYRRQPFDRVINHPQSLPSSQPTTA
jgi:hypothetical protein